MNSIWTLVLLVLTFLIFTIILWAILCFNRLILLQNRQKEGWSGIEVQLKRRHDLVPLLVSAVKGYAAHEQSTFQAVTEARSQAIAHLTPGESPQAESNLSGSLGNVLLLAEDYPDLKASGNFHTLMEELVQVENDIQFARRFYNGAVRDFSNQAQMFPGNLVAGTFQFIPGPYFELSLATEKEAPEVHL